jgi:lysyl-tRNA synthetase class 2
MANIDEVKEVRLSKLEKIKAAGKNPYPSVVKKDYTLSEVKDIFDTLDDKIFSVAGRVMSLRGQGAICFVPLFDGTATFQAVFHKGEIADEDFAFFKDVVDAGDFISVTGKAFTTQKGEKSILVTSFEMASKSLLPLPEKWHGIQDDDLRYRKRYLDIATNEEVREMFIKKALFWKTIRNFLEEKGFMAVETPTLELTTGGAEAAPFATHHNDYDLPVYLRISVGELWQKRLMAAGFPKTYEIGRAYRNEGSSPNHLQEFTNVELYWSFADYTMGMDLITEMYRRIALDVFGKTEFTTRGHTFDLAAPWTKISYTEEIKRQTGVDVEVATKDEVESTLRKLSVAFDGVTKERMIDSLWKYCRKNISGPSFVVDYPDFMQPLAKRSEKNPRKVEQFQVLLGGAEIGKGYSELNDPIDQRERFEHQQELLKAGDKEAMMADWDFVEMLEHSMPPTFGFGAGERLFAFLVDKPIREVTLFPLMKPKSE